MKILNIFKAICLFLTCVMILFALYYASTFKPYPIISYSLSDPLSELEKVDNEQLCPIKGEAFSFIRHTNTGIPFFINICLLPMEFDEDKKLLIPFKVDDENTVYGAENFSAEVFQYKNIVEENFKLSPTDENLLKKESKNIYLLNWLKIILMLVFSLLIFRRFIIFIDIAVSKKLIKNT